MDIILQVLLPLVVAFVMFCLGLGLTPADFQRIAQRPRAALLGAFNQILLLPLAALSIIWSCGFEKETAVGLMILAACPGGPVSNVVTRAANWDVALSVTLTASYSLSCVVTIPLILEFAMWQFMGQAAPEVDVSATALTAFALTALPLLVGVCLRTLAPRYATRVEPRLSKVATLTLAVTLLLAVNVNWQIFFDNIVALGFGLVALIALLLTIAHLGSRLMGTTAVEAKTIAVETTLQNGGLGISIAAILLPGAGVFNAYAFPAMLYSVLCLAAVVPILALLQHRISAAPIAPAAGEEAG